MNGSFRVSESPHTKRLRELANEGEDSDDWEEITARTDVHVHLEKPMEKPTKPDNAPPSETPKIAKGAVSIISAVNNPYALGALALLVVALWLWLTKR